MTASADLAYRNFVWRLEAITPANTAVTDKKFRFNARRIEDAQASGTIRNFVLYWLGSGADEYETDMSERRAPHNFQLEVTYPATTKVDLQTLSTMLLQDRHDIATVLRDPAYYDGYDDSNTSTKYGLWSRVRDSDEIARDENNWTLRQRWSCLIREQE